MGEKESHYFRSYKNDLTFALGHFYFLTTTLIYCGVSYNTNMIPTPSFSIRLASDYSDFLKYLFFLSKERFPTWTLYILIMKFCDWKQFQLFLIEHEGEIIGGFCITHFPIIKYKPYNWFNREARAKVQELRDKGYYAAATFFIKKEFRNNGIGTTLFNEELKKHNINIYFSSSPKARNLYLRNGARIVYESTYDIFVFDEQSRNARHISQS